MFIRNQLTWSNSMKIFTSKLLQRSSMALVGAFLLAAPALAQANTGAGGMATRLTEQAKAIFPFVGTFLQLAGVVMLGIALFGFKKAQESNGQYGVSGPVVRMLVALGLMAVPQVAGIGLGTFFKSDTMSAEQDDSKFGIERQ